MFRIRLLQRYLIRFLSLFCDNGTTLIDSFHLFIFYFELLPLISTNLLNYFECTISLL